MLYFFFHSEHRNAFNCVVTALSPGSLTMAEEFKQYVALVMDISILVQILLAMHKQYLFTNVSKFKIKTPIRDILS